MDTVNPFGGKMAKYREINQWLRAKIQDGTYTANDRLPSENDLAGRFGCSRQTVRQAISPLLQEGVLGSTRGSGTYVSEQAAGLLKPPAMRIGVLLAYPEDPSFSDILSSLERTLSSKNYTISIGLTHNLPTEEENCLRRILDNGVDGMIIEGTKTALPNGNSMLYQEMEERNIPVVFLNSFHKGCRASYVVTDDVRAGEMAAEALIADGHTRIGGFFPSDDSRGLKRYEGFRHALARKGISLPEHSVFWYTSENLPYLFTKDYLLAENYFLLTEDCLPAEGGFLARDSKNQRFPHYTDITGLACSDGRIAASWLSMLRQCGKTDFRGHSIVSFGAWDLLGFPADAMPCTLTCVQCPPHRIGQLAAELILKKISNPSCHDQITLTPEIKILSKKGNQLCLNN